MYIDLVVCGSIMEYHVFSIGVASTSLKIEVLCWTLWWRNGFFGMEMGMYVKRIDQICHWGFQTLVDSLNGNTLSFITWEKAVHLNFVVHEGRNHYVGKVNYKCVFLVSTFEQTSLDNFLPQWMDRIFPSAWWSHAHLDILDHKRFSANFWSLPTH